MPQLDEIKKQSVTANDSGSAYNAGVLRLILNPTWHQTSGLAEWWSPARDYQLRQTLYQEDLWASAIAIATTKMSSLKWDIDSPAPRLAAYAQQLLLSADGDNGWTHFLARHLQDYLLTDNGAFVEIVRASSAAGSRIIGLFHLDSLRCTRTGDIKTPCIYRDTLGVEHALKAHQIVMLSDMPNPGETWYGVGLCAASRAYNTIQKMRVIENYIYDKVSGQRSLALDLVKGITDEKLRLGIESAREMREAQSGMGKAFQYMGATLLPILSDAKLEHIRINFAELPDGFDRQKEFDMGVLKYADAIGLDPQDLQPLTGRPLGSGEQSMILDEKSKGRGLNAWRQALTHQINEFVVPDRVTFAFSERDIRDEKLNAEISKMRSDTLAVQIDKQIITSAQAAQILADEDRIPREFVPEDQTDAVSLSDSEKPEAEAEAVAQQTPNGEPAPVVPVVKSRRDVAREYKQELFDFSNRTMKGKMSAVDMARAHRELIRTLAPSMYDEALRANGIDPQDRDEADDSEIAGWIAEQLPHVKSFADDVANASDEAEQNDIARRIDLWVAALEMLGQLGIASASKNTMGTWRLGNTEEHCNDDGDLRGCKQLNGQRHRVKWFVKNGYIPREPGSQKIKCGGWACDCKVVGDNGRRLL